MIKYAVPGTSPRELLSQKYGPGFSPRTLQKMRHFYTHHSIPPISAELGWSDYTLLGHKVRLFKLNNA
ncbi:MAG: hypothetical protein KAS92_02875 [Candidatus Omnitrophica bacterium]|nr:hypothetical protein [Candidatus Omnitrophota bacterium]